MSHKILDISQEILTLLQDAALVDEEDTVEAEVIGLRRSGSDPVVR